MKKLKGEIDFQSQDGKITEFRLKTPLGVFYGVAIFNDEKDPLTPSKILGGQIAECRAYINFYNRLIEIKRYELKGVKRLAGSIPKDKHPVKMVYVVEEELQELINIRDMYKKDIQAAIAGRELYIRSRTEDKVAKKEKLDKLGAAIKALGQNTSKDS